VKYILVIIYFISMNAYSCESKNIVIKDDAFETDVIEYSKLGLEYKKAILIIPPTGGVNFIDKSYAKSLCESGLKAVIIKNWTGDDEYNLELAIHTRFYRRAQKAIAMTVLKYKRYVLGILGTSVGGLHAAIATSRFREITSSFLIVAGGNIPEIIANTTQEVLKDAKEKRFKMFNFKSNQEYISALEKVVPFEPLNLPVPSRTKKIGMVISTNDHVVPSLNQEKLRTHWSPKTVWRTWFGHKAAVVKTWLFSTQKIIDFFRD